ncbi:MAG: Uma2 family endonuclease [Cyanobacterium sp. T60_A2020_053]|nr:Uma2 family endonuclease [Cyanobacterium sp. T60_A2020_053]
MAVPTLTPPTENKTENEIKFPQGEFYSNEPPLETYQHLQQIIILLQSLQYLWRDRKDYFCAGNLTIYYSARQKKSEYFRGPDFFVVLDTTNDETRKSWVVWEEGGKYPHLIVEILSKSTAQTDREEKKQIYQDIFRTPNYFWFDPFTLEFQGFVLISGKYQPITPNEQGWLYSEQLGLYLGIYEGKLRYFTEQGKLVLTPEESAEKLAQKLRELGYNPDEI